MLQRERIHGFVQAAWSKQRGIKRFAVARRAANDDVFVIEAVLASDKELVRSALASACGGLTGVVAADATLFLQHPYRR
jgi:hypothetical protein